jgi:hypothetical protein
LTINITDAKRESLKKSGKTLTFYLGKYMSNINGDVDKLWEDADNDGNGFLDKSEAPYFLDEICKMMHPSRA